MVSICVVVPYQYSCYGCNFDAISKSCLYVAGSNPSPGLFLSNHPKLRWFKNQLPYGTTTCIAIMDIATLSFQKSICLLTFKTKISFREEFKNNEMSVFLNEF